MVILNNTYQMWQDNNITSTVVLSPDPILCEGKGSGE